MAHYAAAKAGILGLTRSFAQEGTDDNTPVNAICPGPLATDTEPLGSGSSRGDA